MFNRKMLLFTIAIVFALSIVAGSVGPTPVAADTTETWVLHLNLRDTGNTTAIGVKDMGAYMDVYYCLWWKDAQDNWHSCSNFSQVPDQDIYAISTCNAFGYTFYKTPSVAVTVSVPPGAVQTVMEWFVATYRPSSQASNCSVKYMQDSYREKDDFAYTKSTNWLWNYFQQENW
jgi:hypothetical protein